MIPSLNLASGMVATAIRTISESLDRLPNKDDRTKIAIICFDVALHFFSIAVSATIIKHTFILKSTNSTAKFHRIHDACCIGP